MSSGSLQGRRPLFLYLVQIRCRCCSIVFSVCRCCRRGQAYCCDECRVAGTQKNHREAQGRYRRTAKGKKAHREAENRRWHGLSKKDQKNHGVFRYYSIWELSFAMPGHGLTRLDAAISADLEDGKFLDFSCQDGMFNRFHLCRHSPWVE